MKNEITEMKISPGQTTGSQNSVYLMTRQRLYRAWGTECWPVWFIFPTIWTCGSIVVVQLLSHVQLFATPWTAAHQASLPSPGVCSNSCPLSLWCHSTISSSVVPFSYHLQSFPASGFFQMSQFSASGGRSIGVSASTSVLPVNIQGWFPLGLTGLITLPSKGLSRVFSNTTVQKHQFFGAQPTLWSNSHTDIWLLEKP